MSEKIEPPEGMDFEYEITSNMEYMTSAASALNAISEIDEMILTNAGRNRVRNIRRKSLRIIDRIINDMYDELFDETTDADLA
jgi:hypothetical protein